MRRKQFFSKLFGISSWNFGAAVLNFSSNILIAKIFGVSTFGEITLILTFIGLTRLVLLIMPPSFVLIKLQEKDEYLNYYITFFIIASCFVMGVSYIFASQFNLPGYVLVLYSFSVLFQNFFDVVLQAENKLNSYFFLLFLLGGLKVFSILMIMGYCFVRYDSFKGVHLDTLLMIISISQILLLGYYFLPYRKKTSLTYLAMLAMIRELNNNKKIISTYYLSAAIKSLNSNLIVLLFGSSVTKEILGIFSLILKIVTFVLGLARTVEAIMLNKIASEKYLMSLNSNLFLIGFLLQILLLIIGTGYMFFISGNLYLKILIIFSFLIYPYLFFVEARAQYLHKYLINKINISSLIYLFSILNIYIIMGILKIEIGLFHLCFVFIISSLSQYLFLIYDQKTKAFNS